MNYDPANFKDIVRNQRNRLRMNKEEYANKMGVSGVTVAKWEDGRMLPEGAKLLAILAREQKDGIGESPRPPAIQPEPPEGSPREKIMIRFMCGDAKPVDLPYTRGQIVTMFICRPDGTPWGCTGGNGGCGGGDK